MKPRTVHLLLLALLCLPAAGLAASSLVALRVLGVHGSLVSSFVVLFAAVELSQ